MKKTNKLLQIAIDGPASSGKTTIAQKLAKYLKIKHLSTGNIFRCFALKVKKINYSNPKKVKEIIEKINLTFKNNKFYLDNKDVTSLLNNETIGHVASTISQQKFVRQKYEKITKEIIRNKSIILDGRDIGTIIIPKTKYKFYLNASLNIRAQRRLRQLKLNPSKIKTISKALLKRDNSDKKRKLAALKIAKNAIVINTDNKTISEIMKIIKIKILLRKK